MYPELSRLLFIKAALPAEFLIFCDRNPRPCPIMDITDAGSPHPHPSPEADLRTDLPKDNIIVNGELKRKPKFR
jgi:uncharacterized protein YcsI (UPF0317 family)